jgi:hypothetical protein
MFSKIMLSVSFGLVLDAPQRGDTAGLLRPLHGWLLRWLLSTSLTPSSWLLCCPATQWTSPRLPPSELARNEAVLTSLEDGFVLLGYV